MASSGRGPWERPAFFVEPVATGRFEAMPKAYR